MYSMFDLPTEGEMNEAILEASKKKKAPENPSLESDTFFKFWTPKGPQGAVKVSDKTGVVKSKTALGPAQRIDEVWTNFLKEQKAKAKYGAKPVTEVDNFGSVVVDSFAQNPDPKKLVGSVKALKKTTVKEMSGKVTTKTEELGVGKVITKSEAASPNKDKLVGIVKPKEAMGKQNMPSDVFKPGSAKVNDVSGTTTIVKTLDGKLKATENPVETKSFADKPGKDNSGAVEPKSAMKEGKKVFKPIDGFKK